MNLYIIYDFPYAKVYSKPNSIFYFISLYIIGGYIRKFDFLPRFKGQFGKLYFLFGFICLIFYFFKTLKNGNIFHFTFPVFNGLSFFISVLFFLWAKNLRLNIDRNKIIYRIAPLTFGVYLIHDHEYIRNILWSKLIENPDNILCNKFFLPNIIIYSSIIFLSCIFIEKIRIVIFDIIGLLYSNIKKKLKQ